MSIAAALFALGAFIAIVGVLIGASLDEEGIMFGAVIFGSLFFAAAIIIHDIDEGLKTWEPFTSTYHVTVPESSVAPTKGDKPISVIARLNGADTACQAFTTTEGPRITCGDKEADRKDTPSAAWKSVTDRYDITSPTDPKVTPPVDGAAPVPVNGRVHGQPAACLAFAATSGIKVTCNGIEADHR